MKDLGTTDLLTVRKKKLPDGTEETDIELTPSKKGALAGAAAGAALGSVVPVIGTGLGAALGGVVGFIFGPKD